MKNNIDNRVYSIKTRELVNGTTVVPTKEMIAEGYNFTEKEIVELTNKCQS